MDMRYSGPHPGNIINGINSMNWAYQDPVHGKRIDCTSPLNGSLPGDRTDDDIFIVNAKRMQEDCFII